MAIAVLGFDALVWAKPVFFELDGRAAVVRVYKSKAQRRANQCETMIVTIKGRSIEVEMKDANESTIWELFAHDQKDAVVRKYLERNTLGYNRGDGPIFYLPIRKEELEGREVAARLYKDGERDISSYKRLIAVISGWKVKYDAGDSGHAALLVVFGEDQEDPVVRQVLGTTVQGWDYSKGLELHMPFKMGRNERAYCWSFFDALGYVISGAKAELYLKSKKAGIFLGHYDTNSDGQLCLPFGLGGLKNSKGGIIGCDYELRVQVAGYGTSIFESWAYRQGGELYIPRVQVSSEADARSAWGRVVDSNGNAVKGAIVWGGLVTAAGAKVTRGVEGQREGVVTDEYGRFRMYVPIRADAEQIGTLIPPSSQYCVRIEPSKEKGLLSYKGVIRSGRDNVITLERPERYFHTFSFENESGPITDENKLCSVRIKIKRAGTDVFPAYAGFKDGGLFPLGRYEVERCEDIGSVFVPIEVTADSPEKLVFKVIPARRYYGRALDGITGAPVAGAKVRVSMAGSGLTVDDGSFEVEALVGEKVLRVIVSKVNYLTVFVNESWTKQDEHGRYDVGDVKLFPSATVSVDLVSEVTKYCGAFEFRPQWFLHGVNPSWVKDFEAGCMEHPQEGIFRDYEVKANGRVSFPVPAGLSLRVNLRVRGDIEWVPVTIAKSIRLEQGETFDAGKVVIVEPFAVFVDVRNSSGSPVEGIPVIACGDWDPAVSSSDENGIAMFEFVGYSTGDFIVEHKPKDANLPVLRESIPYEVKGVEDANSIYTFKVSDKLIGRILK